MQITTEFIDGVLEMRLAGRLDNEAADDLTVAVDQALHRGHHAVLLDLAPVDYISSAGLGAMVRALKKFQAIRGVFGIARLSPPAAEVLKQTGLSKLLVCDAEQVRRKYSSNDGTVLPSFRVAVADDLQLSIYDLDQNAQLECQIWSDVKLTSGARRSSQVPFPADTFGLGIGAFGRDFDDCADRFGEFVAVAGGAAVQPTPEGRKPDYQIASGNFFPEPQLLYGASLSGAFSQMIRFEPETLERYTGFSSVVDQCLVASHHQVAGMVIVGEAAGLIAAFAHR